jgi:hypothetical protein
VVTIIGAGFTGATGVAFGPNPGIGMKVHSGTRITAQSPAGQLGTVDITVTTPLGTSLTNRFDQFTYTSKPVDRPLVLSVTPSSGDMAGGTLVTITGARFTGATGVAFGPNPGIGMKVHSDTRITAQSPAGQLGTVDITVTTPLGTSLTNRFDQFTYEVPKLL